MMQRSTVDLPEPLRPVSAMACPELTVRLKLSTMTWSPYFFIRSVTLRTVSRLAMAPIVTCGGNDPPTGPPLGLTKLRQRFDPGRRMGTRSRAYPRSPRCGKVVGCHSANLDKQPGDVATMFDGGRSLATT